MPKSILSSENWVDKNKKITITRKICESAVKLHMHDYFEIELITGGSGIQNLNGDLYELKKGTLYFLSPIDFHSVIPHEHLPLINVSFSQSAISQELLTSLLHNEQSRIVNLNDDELAKFEFIIGLLEEGISCGDEQSALYVKNLLECLLILIMRKNNFLHNKKTESESFPLRQCMRHVFLNFSRSPSLAETAKISGYSANYFSKKFHEATGKTYVDFLNDLKLNYAGILLLSTDDSITSIAENCGFLSLSNFNGAFRKFTGMSPTQYRKQNGIAVKSDN